MVHNPAKGMPDDMISTGHKIESEPERVDKESFEHSALIHEMPWTFAFDKREYLKLIGHALHSFGYQ